MAYAHPVLFRRLEAARQARPHMRIIVADPRRTDTAPRPTCTRHHPARHRRRALPCHVLHVMVAEALVDRAYIEGHTEGFGALQ